MAVLLAAPFALGQGSHRDYDEHFDEANVTVPPEYYEDMRFRSVGFTRGGRSTAATGVPGDPLTYYFGGTGGGVFKTTDAGHSWTNVSDGFFGVGSVGSVRVAPSDTNVIYVGTGSASTRGNISVGDGMYRSDDAGKTWEHVGLRHAGQIGALAIHPEDPDLVYAAALGYIFGPNDERGIFRTKDGGQTWERVLHISDRTGFVEIQMDPNNPRILYAGAWRAERKPWTIISGSFEDGVYISRDGGDTWNQATDGLPTGLRGKSDLAVSPADPDRVYVLIEAPADTGGVYRSDDRGATWHQVTDFQPIRNRPFYYTNLEAHPTDPDILWGMAEGHWMSTDGGRNWTRRPTPHGDNHDLWINPDNPLNMINANDGGANVSFDGGKSWTDQMGQETSEMYRVYVDDQWPYRIYGSQQDNSTISVPSRSGFTVVRDWYQVGGCESGHIAVDPRDPDIIYAGCYGGSITRVNRRTGEFRQILHYPQLQLGQAARDLNYRFQWNAPIRLSPHDPDILYHASQVVHMSRDQGQSWQVISPDLTTNNPEHQDYAGGPITRDNTGVEVYNTLFSFEESPHTPAELWAGSDDGRVHISRDRGDTWTEITPDDMPAGGTVNVIEMSSHDPARVFIAVYRYRENDFRPYIFRTNDSGESWDLLTDGTNGIPPTHFTRAIREDHDRKGLLYAGTEFGLYVSFDDGAHWQRFQNNLPVSPITDLQVHRKDLVIATQGRSFWVLDDLSPLHQVTDETMAAASVLYAPRTAYRGGFGSAAEIRYHLKEQPDSAITLEILDSDGNSVRKVTGQPGAAAPTGPVSPFAAFFGGGPRARLPAAAGLNSFRWNLRSEGIQRPAGVVHWGGTPGLSVVPGTYEVRLTVGEETHTQPLEVAMNPNLSSTADDLAKQRELGETVAGEITKLFDALNRLRDVKSQAGDIVGRLRKAGKADEELGTLSEALTDRLTEIEETITQTNSKSSQDPINFPPQIDNQLVTLYGYIVQGDYEPTAGAYERFDDLKPELDAIHADLEAAMSEHLNPFNERVASLGVPAVLVATEEN